MKLTIRVVMMLALIATLVAPLAASAQEEQPCYGLSPADCALYYSTEPAMKAVNAFSMGYTFALSVSGMADVNSDGSGNFTFDPDAMDPFSAVSLNMDINGTANDLEAGESMSGTFSFVMTDGYFYMTDPEGGGWVGFLLSAAADAMAEESGLNLEDLMSGDLSGMGDMSAMEDLDVAPLTDLMTKYVTIERGADMQVGGNPVAVFTTNLDLPGLFADTQLGAVIGNLIAGASAAGAAEGAGMSEEEMQQMTAQLPMIIAMVGVFFTNTTLSMTQHVGINDSYLYGFGIDFDMSLDPMMLAGLTGETAEPDAEPLDISLSLAVELTNHNGMFTFTAPAEFVDITDEMQSGMSGF